MYRLIPLLTLLLTYSFGYGVENYYTTYKVADEIVVGDSLQLADPQYFQYKNGTSRYKSLVSRVFLEIREDDRILLDSNWSATVNVLVSYTDTSGNVTIDVPIELKVDYKDGTADYARKDVFQIKNAHFIKYKITHIGDTTLLRYLRLGLELGNERYFIFDYNSTVTNLAHSHNAYSNHLEISWSPVRGAELYEIAWLWLDNYTSNGKEIPLSQTTTSFQNNATRIRSKFEHYEIPLIYDRGYIVYRVRPIGIVGADFKHLIKGQWSAPSHNEEFYIATTLHKFRLKSGHEIHLNYQYFSTLNEEGLRTGTVKYLDGLLMSRQSVSSLRQEHSAMVSEIAYDHQGRTGITFLPAPGSERLTYHRNFNVNQGFSSYSALDFDLDTSYFNITGAPSNEVSGSAKYYSTSNPNKAAHQGFLPIANGYPFAQMSYTNDNTDRIEAYGNTGRELQIGSGHEIRLYYSKPFQVELDRLFGNEVGYANQYNKTITIDPNGVKKVSYSDGSGNIIATALASATAPNLLSIDLEVDTVRANLLDNNHWNSKFEKTASQPLVVLDSGTFFFNFETHIPQYTYFCDTTTFCFNVNYSVLLSVINNDGLEMIPGGSLLFNLGDTGSTIYSCSGIRDTSLNFQLTLAQGQYTISKKLILDTEAIEEFVDSVALVCIAIEDFLLPPDTSGCKIDCEQCSVLLGNKPQFLNQGGTESMWDDMVQTCDAMCATISRCGTYYKAMLLDVSPDGYYGGVWNDTGLFAPQGFPNSVFNQYNSLGGNYDWRYPLIPYVDSDGIADSIQDTDGQLYAPEDVSIEVFIYHWEPSWAQSLVQYHPEYCFYQRCIEFEEYRDYETTILSTFSFQTALSLGYVNPLGMSDTTLIPSILAAESLEDPLFLAGEAGEPYVDSMLAWLTNYQHSGLSLWDFVGLVTGCSACDSQCDTLDFGNQSILNAATLDQQWQLYRSFYLGLRNKILGLIEAQWQINSNCFNTCLDQQYAFGVVEQFYGNEPASFDSTFTVAVDHSYLFDSLLNTDSACYFINEVPPPILSGGGTDLTSPGSGNVQTGSTVYLYNEVDSCVCSTIENLFREFATNDLIAFTAHYNAVFTTNLNLTQISGLLSACGEQEHPAGGHTTPPGRCLFDDPFIYLPSNPNCDSAIVGFDEVCATTCATYISYWRQQLSSCISDSNLINNLIERMTAICEAGCDPIHPMGSSSSPDSVLTIHGDNSFLQVIQDYSPCNPYIVGMPFPYDYKMANSQEGQIDSCACSSVVSALQAYPNPSDLIGFTEEYTSTYNVSLSVSEIKTFLCICSGTVDTSQLCDPNMELSLLVSNSIRCDYCVNCAEIENMLTQFTAQYPSVGISYPNSSIVQNYLNIGLNYNLGFSKYVSYMDSSLVECEDPSAIVCNSPVFPELPTDSSCYSNAILFAQQNAEYAYQHHLDSLKDIVLTQILHEAVNEPLEEYEMRYILKEGYYTLYYYDRAGNLERTVPPKGVDIIKDSSMLAAVQSHRIAPQANPPVYPNHTLSSRYLYNSYKGTSVSHTPDGGVKTFWHDKSGRLIASQLSNQVSENKYNYMVYDGLGRKTESGELEDNSLISILNGLNNADLLQWVDDGKKYHFIKTYFDSSVFFVQGLSQNNLRNKVVCSEKFDLQSGGLFRTHYTYDTQGNVRAVVQENSLIPMAHRFKKTEYEYDPIRGAIHRILYQLGHKDQFIHRYTYDLDTRLASVETSIDGFEWEDDASYSYYSHGSLARKEIGDQRVQGLDYTYTLQGWLKSINSTTLSAAEDPGMDGDISMPGNPHLYVARDAFGYVLQYNSDDYAPINSFTRYLTNTNGSNLFLNSGELYNGNIPLTLLSKQGESIIGKSYRYDVLNRIKSSEFYSNFDSINAQWLNNGNFSQEFSTFYNYDLNGNFTNLSRKGTLTTSLYMDELEYFYNSNSNQLAYVEDTVERTLYGQDLDNQWPQNYGYDLSGNLIYDKQEDIIYSWSSLGKIKRINRKGLTNKPKTSFFYDASDNRVLKEVEGDSTLWYVYGADNSLMAIYGLKSSSLLKTKVKTREVRDNGLISLSGALYYDTDGTIDSSGTIRLVEIPIYGSEKLGSYEPNRELNAPVAGSVKKDTSSLRYNRGNKRYILKDQVENVQMVLSDKNSGNDVNNDSLVDYYNAVVLNSTDYYPFGMEIPGRGGEDTKYRYGFQGQENDDEVKGNGNAVNYTYRMHDPRLGRFFAVDPITKLYPSTSPYVFSQNRVIDAIELEGLELFPIHGTWGNIEAWSNPEMMNQLQSLFGNTRTIIRIRRDEQGKAILRKEKETSWSGYNNDDARRQAAKKYVEYIKKNMIEGEPITILGHSHGGNVSIIVMDIIANDPYFEGVEFNLISLNTPSRDYVLSGMAISNVSQYNIFNRKDIVQISGGKRIKIGAGENMFGELVGAKRTFAGAHNIEYKSAATGVKGYHQGWRLENYNVWYPQLKRTVNQNTRGQATSPHDSKNLTKKKKGNPKHAGW